MSLTEILRTGLDHEIASFIPKPDIGSYNNCPAPPRTQNYALVGTAFDYLLRLELKRRNPRAVEGEYTAVLAYNLIKNGVLALGTACFNNTCVDEAEFEYVKLVARDFFAEREKFLQTGQLTDALIIAIIKFARLDQVYRALIYDNTREVDPADIEDMKALYALVPPELKRPMYPVFLNPDFTTPNLAADPDLILEDALIDIKTVKRMEVSDYYWSQVVSYLALADWLREHEKRNLPRINRIGLYFARFGVIWTTRAEPIRANPYFERLKRAIAEGHLNARPERAF